MPVQALFLDQVHPVNCLRYAWADDGTVMLALECDEDRARTTGEAMTFQQLIGELAALCPWQQSMKVTVGTRHALAEVLTIYHAFESAKNCPNSLMLVSTPPDEYFEAA